MTLIINISERVYMQFLSKKCSLNESLLIRVNDQLKGSTDSVKFLGIFFYQKLTWEPHITQYVVTELSSACFLIRQLRGTVISEVLKIVYFSIVQTDLSYN